MEEIYGGAKKDLLRRFGIVRLINVSSFGSCPNSSGNACITRYD
jgi:hypothetical protein